MKINQKITLIFSFILLITCQLMAQKKDLKGGEKVRALKVGMITEELKLTETQAIKFWPVYNAFSEKRQNINKQIRKINNEKDDELENDEILKNEDQVLKLRQDELELIKEYRDDFLKVISVQQYADLQATEKKFNKLLLEKLKERKSKE